MTNRRGQAILSPIILLLDILLGHGLEIPKMQKQMQHVTFIIIGYLLSRTRILLGQTNGM